MKEKLTLLEEIAENIFDLTAKFKEIVPKDSERGRVIFQALTKLSIEVNDIHLKTIKKERL